MEMPVASYSKSVLSYQDVYLAFEQAGRLGSITLQFDTPAAATTWTGRANAYRVLLRKQNQAEGRDFASEFDHLMVRRKPGERTVVIEPRGFNFKAIGPNGEEIDFNKQTLSSSPLTPHEKTKALKEVDDFLSEFEREQKK